MLCILINSLLYFIIECKYSCLFFSPTMKFGSYLKHHGFKDKIWQVEFEKHDILSEDDILGIKGSETAAKVLTDFEIIATENEIKILRNIFGIPTESQVPYKPGIESDLNSVGLDPKYWSRVFYDKLGITSSRALQFVGSESYLILEQSARYIWEKKALREILNLTKVQKSQRKQQNEMTEQFQEKSRKFLQQLKEFRDKGIDRSNKQVGLLVSEVCMMFHIPLDSWNTSLDDLIKIVEARDNIFIGELHSRTQRELDDTMVLRCASGGLALTGILLTSRIEDQLQDRSCLLRIPENVTLLGPSHCQGEWIEEFTSKEQEDLYIKCFNKFGYSVSTSAKAGFWGFQLELSAGYTKNSAVDDTKQTHKHSIYYSTVKHSSMPLASYCFSDRDLLLSADALSALRVIETKLTTFGENNKEVMQACEEFFERFGSHANRGPLHFGGVYWLKCFTSGIKESEIAIVKQLQNEVVGAHGGISYFGVGVSGLKTKYAGNCSEATISQTHIEILKNGGPPEVSTLTDWKTCLVASNSTWSVIDRGTMLVPVWEIISNNHPTELNQVSALVKILHMAWECIAKLHTQIGSLSPSNDVTHVVKMVTIWNEASSMSQEELQDCINILIQVKQSLIKSTMNPEAWSLLYLTQPQIQMFLKSVLDAQNVAPSPPEAVYVKLLMQQLVQKSDLTFNFPHMQEFLQWLYDEAKQQQQKSSVCYNCDDIISFCRFLDLVVEKLKESQDRNSPALEKVLTQICDSETSAAVAMAIKSLLKNLRMSSVYEFILMTTLIYPFIHLYGYDESITLKQLSLGDIVFLSKALTVQRKEFYNIFTSDGSLRIQAYLFYLAVDMYRNEREVDISEMQLKEHVQFMQKVLGNILQGQLKETLSVCLSDNTDWRNIQADLSFYTSNTNHKHERQQSTHCLEHSMKCLPVSNKQIKGNSEIEAREAILAATDSIESIEILHFFDALDLTKYYPKKLTLQLALCIRQDALRDSKCTDPRNLPFFILRKIMAYDYRCRSELCQAPIDDKDCDDSSSSESDDSDDLESFFTALDYVYVEVHPLDGLLAVLHCADDFLRQDLMSRLATCQLAIPFLLPDPFTRKLTLPLWAMKTIVKEWKCTQSGRESLHEGPIINYKADQFISW